MSVLLAVKKWRDHPNRQKARWQYDDTIKCLVMLERHKDRHGWWTRKWYAYQMAINLIYENNGIWR